MKYPTFATWVQKRRRKRSEYPEKKLFEPISAEITFVESQIDQAKKQSPEEGTLEVRTLYGIELRIRSQDPVASAAELIRSLDKTPGMLSFSGSLRVPTWPLVLVLSFYLLVLTIVDFNHDLHRAHAGHTQVSIHNSVGCAYCVRNFDVCEKNENLT